MNPPFPANQGGTHSPYVEKSRKCIRRADTRVNVTNLRILQTAKKEVKLCKEVGAQ